MKHIITVLIAVLTATLLHAADPVFSYEGEVSGVVCQVCSGKVKHSLEQLPGVKSVKLTPGKNPGTAKIRLDSTSKELNLDAAVKALGKDASSYTITRFALLKP